MYGAYIPVKSRGEASHPNQADTWAVLQARMALAPNRAARFYMRPASDSSPITNSDMGPADAADHFLDHIQEEAEQISTSFVSAEEEAQLSLLSAAAAADVPPAAVVNMPAAAAASQEEEVEVDLDPADFWGKEDRPPDRGEGWTTQWATPEECGGEYTVHGIGAWYYTHDDGRSEYADL